MKNLLITFLFIISLACVSVFGQDYTIENHSDGIATFQKDRQMGLIDIKTKTVILPPKYSEIGDFSEGLAFVRTRDEVTGKQVWGYINKLGKVVIPLVYEYAWDFTEGLAPVKKDGKWGYVNKLGNVVIPFKYNQVRSFSEGVAVVREADSSEVKFLIDKLGNKLSPERNFGSVSGGVVRASTSQYKCGFTDKTGKIIVPFEYDECEVDPTSRVLTVRAGNQTYNILDITGKKLSEVSSSQPFLFREGLAKIANGATKATHFIDKTGKVIIPEQQINALIFSSGLVAFKKFKKDINGYGSFGFIDKTGKEVIAPKFIDVDLFKGEYARVKETQQSQWYLIDKTGKCVLGCPGEVIKAAFDKPAPTVKPAVARKTTPVKTKPLSTKQRWR